MDSAAPNAVTPSPLRPVHRLKRLVSAVLSTAAVLFMLCVMFPNRIPRIPGLHPRLSAKAVQVGDRQAVAVFADPGGPPVHGVGVRVGHPGGVPDTCFNLGTLAPGEGVLVGAAGPTPNGLVPVQPYTLAEGDSVYLLGEPYRLNIVYRSGQMDLDPAPVTYFWHVRCGVLHDDVVLTNTAPMALTNVVLRPHIEGGGKTLDLELTAPRVGPGESVKWADVLSVPGSQVDHAASFAPLQCDQSRAR